MIRRPPRTTRPYPPFPYTTLFRSHVVRRAPVTSRELKASRVQPHRLSAAAIDRIANDRCAKARRGMHPDLVRPAGKRAELDQRPPPALFDRSPAGLRGLALWIGDHPPTLGARRALVERQVDQPAPALRHAFKRSHQHTSEP